MSFSLLDFLEESFLIWGIGGYVMLALFFMSLFIYTNIFISFYSLKKLNLDYKNISKIEDSFSYLLPKYRELIENMMSLNDVKKVIDGFENFKSIYVNKYKKSMSFTKKLIICTPLLGLLGTVSGMLYTFNALSKREGIDVMAHITKGISEALLTTQMGLMISIFSFAFCSYLYEKSNAIANDISFLEVLTLKYLKLKGI